MPVDTSIYGMIQQPKIKTPQEHQMEAYSIRNMGLENELRQQQTATARAMEKQRVADLNSQQEFQRAVRDGADDRTLMGKNAKMASDLFESRAKIGREKAQEDSAKVEAQGKGITNEQNEYKLGREKLGDLYSRLSQIKDESTYYKVINQGFDDGVLDMQLAHELVDHPFNLEEIQGLSQKMLTDMQKLEIKEKIFTAQQKAKTGPLEVSKLENDVASGKVDPVTGLTRAQKADDDRAMELVGLQKDQLKETKRHHQTTEWQADEKLKIDKIEKAAIGKGMSQESAKVYAIAETMVPELEKLRDAIQQNPRMAIGGIITGTNPHLVRLAENAADKVGRLRSGGAVNPKEETRFMGQIARKMDLASGDPGPAIEAINGLIEEAKTVKARMTPGAAGAPSGAPAGPSATKGAGPKVGTVEEGHEFMGGNPADPKSWKKR